MVSEGGTMLQAHHDGDDSDSPGQLRVTLACGRVVLLPREQVSYIYAAS